MYEVKDLTPKRIVEGLNKYIIGQNAAKKHVAIAVRNRWRRQQITSEMRDEVTPKNIIMIGPTGVGKTEIARRLANLVKAPFIKVEASKYTEVGYHGRDVDSMVRDLVEISVNTMRQEAMKQVEEKAALHTEEKLLNLLLPVIPPKPKSSRTNEVPVSTDQANKTGDTPSQVETKVSEEDSRQKMRKKLRSGTLDKRMIELKVDEKAVPMMQVFSSSSFEEYGFDMQSMLGNILPAKMVTKKITVAEARKMLLQQESEKLIDKEKIIKEAISRAENSGIIFIDELDKVVSQGQAHGPDVSREGVQRDLLPMVEGATITTRYGLVKSHHILFVAAGAFHVAKPADLIPELQGRFPIRVELNSLNKDDFLRILTEPQNALVKQYQALLLTEGIKLEFSKDAIDEIATMAAEINSKMQNIGARRLQTVIEKVVEDISFEAPEIKDKKITINRRYVKDKLKSIIEDEDLSKYIL